LVDVVTQPRDLLVGEVAHLGVAVDAELVQHLLRRRLADAEDVGEADLDALLARDVDACDTSHLVDHLSLPLLVSGVRADDQHVAVPADDPALLTHRLHARSNLHCKDSFEGRAAPGVRTRAQANTPRWANGNSIIPPPPGRPVRAVPAHA